MTGDQQHDATTEFNEALAAAFAANNFEALGPFFTEDASLLPPRGRPLEGRAAAAAFWGTVANRFGSLVFTPASVKDLGPAVRRETGTYEMAGGQGQGGQGQGGQGQGVEGKYVFVWQLVDGEWQIESGIWNRNGEAGGGRRPGQGQQRQQGQGRGQQGQNRQGGYRGGVGGGAGYRQGGGRPSFQGGGGGIGQGRGGRQGGHGQGGHEQGGGRGGQGGGGSLYDGTAGLYSEPKG